MGRKKSWKEKIMGKTKSWNKSWQKKKGKNHWGKWEEKDNEKS